MTTRNLDCLVTVIGRIAGAADLVFEQSAVCTSGPRSRGWLGVVVPVEEN